VKALRGGRISSAARRVDFDITAAPGVKVQSGGTPNTSSPVMARGDHVVEVDRRPATNNVHRTQCDDGMSRDRSVI